MTARFVRRKWHLRRADHPRSPRTSSSCLSVSLLCLKLRKEAQGKKLHADRHKRYGQQQSGSVADSLAAKPERCKIESNPDPARYHYCARIAKEVLWL